MRDRGESGTSMENPVNNGEQPFESDPRPDLRDHPAPYDWMTGGGRGRRRAMMMSMMMDPRSGMDGGGFGFGGRGGGRGGWFGFGGRGRGNGRRNRYRHGWGYEVDDDEEHVASVAEQMDECHLYEGCEGDGRGSSESSSSSSSSESDDEQNAPTHDVQEKQRNDGDVHKMEGQSTDPAQQETAKSNDKGMEKDQPSSSRGRNRGDRRCKDGRGQHKHRHGKHKHRYHHDHPAFHYSMMPPPPPPHLHGFHRPPFPPMHLPYHSFPDFYDDRDMARKFFKRSMKQWYKAQKRAWKQRQDFHHRIQRSDGDEATSGCDNEDDFEHPETHCQLPPPWLYYSYGHYGRGHGRRGFFRHGKKGKKHGKRRRQCNCGRPLPAEDTPAQTATKDQAGAVDEVEKVNEVREDDQAPMEGTAE